jgi:hypothetical protein
LPGIEIRQQCGSLPVAVLGQLGKDVRDGIEMTLPPPAEGCLPPFLHPVSRHILELFLNGSLPQEEFLRLFSLPNSDYLLVSQCILRQLMS